MTTLRQLRALFGLLLRAWFRASSPGKPPVAARGRRYVLAFVRLSLALGLALAGYPVAQMVRESARHALATALGWQLAGVVITGLGLGFSTELPLPRQKGFRILGSVVQSLPLTLTARTVAVTLPMMLLFTPFWCVLFLAETRASRFLAVGLALSLAAVVVGVAAGKILRTRVLARKVSRVRSVAGLLMLAGLSSPQFSGVLASLGRRAPLFDALARTALGGRTLALGGALAAIAAAALGGALAIRAADRTSYDQDDPLVGDPAPRRPPGALGLARVDVLLQRREPGRWMTSFFLFIALALVSAALVARMLGVSASLFTYSGRVLGIYIGEFVFILGNRRAERGVARDVAARALLASLPLSPRDTLAGKTKQLRLEIGAFALPLAMAVALVPHPLTSDLVWRIPLDALALVLYADAAVAVAFLAHGLGAQSPRQVLISIESFLVAGPFFGVLMAPHLPDALLSFACLAAIRFEAFRSAARALAWIDDGEEGTSTWRALLVLAAFQTIQVLVGSVLAVLFSPGLAAGLAYSGAAVVLAILTLQGRPPAEPARPRPGWIALGALGGLATGLAGAGYLLVLRRLGWFESGPTLPVVPAPLAVVAVLVAPVAEELFFRGWLQRSIASELPPRWQRWAPVVAAAIFAAVHPAVSFVPVLALGLVAGGLFARTRAIHAGVAAHVVHNAVAVTLALFV